MELLTSKKFTLPKVYFTTSREEVVDIPVGVPFIFGDEGCKSEIIRVLEYEVLYQEAIKSGFPFNFRKILRDNGYTDIESFWYGKPVYMEFTTDGLIKDGILPDDQKFSTIKSGTSKFKKYIKDSVVYVDVQKLKKLNVFPIWLDDIEDAVHKHSQFCCI